MEQIRRHANDTDSPGLSADKIRESHRLKTERFSNAIIDGRVALRPGVCRLVQEARAGNLRVGLITTTERQTISSIIDATDKLLDHKTFDLIVDRTMVDEGKPSSEAYRLALQKFDLTAASCISIEDTPPCVRSAVSAGITCIATPNSFHRKADFPDAAAVVTSLGDIAHPAEQLAGWPLLAQGIVTLKKLSRLVVPASA